MNCACRSAALGIFVRSIVRIHVAEAAPLRRLQGLSSISCVLPLRHHFSSLPRRPFRLTGIAHNEAVAHQAENSGNRGGLAHDDEPKKGKPHFNTGSDVAPRPMKRNGGKKDGRGDAADFSGIETQSNPKSQSNSADKSGAKKDKYRKPTEKAETKTGNFGRRPRMEDWQVQKQALREKFPDGWAPRKRLSPDALAGIRALHEQFPDEYTTTVLASKFEVSPEAIRRILKGKWMPSADEEIERDERWFNRGKQVWSRWAELGKKPPRKWRREGIVRDPVWNEKRKKRHQGGETLSVQQRLAWNLM